MAGWTRPPPSGRIKRAKDADSIVNGNRISLAIATRILDAFLLHCAKKFASLYYKQIAQLCDGSAS